MSLFKLLYVSLTLNLILTMVPYHKVMAKQKLDQPALLSADALKDAVQLNHAIPDYVSLDKKGRFFASFPNNQQSSTPALAILNPDQTLIPYPNKDWNQWNDSHFNRAHSDPTRMFINLTGMTLTQDGYLWVLDNGIDQTNKKIIQSGIKIVKIDTRSDQIVQTYPIPASVLRSQSILNTLAIHDHHAYFADKGQPALIVFDLKTNKARHVLENSTSLYSRRPIVVNHKLLRSNSDENSFYNVNQLTITPDGKRIYYQALSGPLYRIDTAYLNDPTYSETELNEAMILWFDTPSSGGITCDDNGNLYFTDIATNSVYRFTTGRILNKLITDKRLQWPGHPFIANNQIYIPAMQLTSYTMPKNTHLLTVKWPLSIYKFSLPAVK